LAQAHLRERLATLTAAWLEPVELPLGFGRIDTIDLSQPASPALDRPLTKSAAASTATPNHPSAACRLSTDLVQTAPSLRKFALVDPLDEKAARSQRAAAPLAARRSTRPLPRSCAIAAGG